jgi:Ca-activated chloride channel homolog
VKQPATAGPEPQKEDLGGAAQPDQGQESAAQAMAPDNGEHKIPNAKDLVLEQWLRQVPDDPSGLLRRKFMLEHQRRLQENNRR